MTDLELHLSNNDRLVDLGAVYAEIFLYSGSRFVWSSCLRGLLVTEVGHGNQESKQVSPRFANILTGIECVCSPVVLQPQSFPMYHGNITLSNLLHTVDLSGSENQRIGVHDAHLSSLQHIYTYAAQRLTYKLYRIDWLVATETLTHWC